MTDTPSTSQGGEYVMVPVVPTREMLAAGSHARGSGETVGDLSRSLAAGVWDNMLSARPAVADARELVARLREAANGLGTLKSARGDFGLLDDAADLIESLGADDGWRTIDSAPKDGRGLLLLDMSAEKPEPGYGNWVFDCWSCIDAEMVRTEPQDCSDDERLFRSMAWVSPTHWRPLPAPPLSGAGEAREHG